MTERSQRLRLILGHQLIPSQGQRASLFPRPRAQQLLALLDEGPHREDFVAGAIWAFGTYPIEDVL